MICVDASLAAKWLLPEPHSPEAIALLRACLSAGDRMVAPPLLPIEVTNVLRQRMRRPPGLTLPDVFQLPRQFLTFPVALTAPAGLYELALTLADTHNLPAVYDAHYLALAQMLGCTLWTADQRLLTTVGGRLSFVKWVGSYRPGDPL
jgi:predicted nucleic acid-binding protein